MKQPVSKPRELTEPVRALILETLKSCSGNYEMAASQLAISASTIRRIDIIYNKKFNWTPEGLGRPELQQYIVAVRDREDTHTWDNTDQKIIEARMLHDAGIADMLTGNDGMNIILYSIPRPKPEVSRKNYFAPSAPEEFASRRREREDA